MSLEDTKVLKDFTTEVDEKVPAAHKLAENVRSYKPIYLGFPHDVLILKKAFSTRTPKYGVVT